MSPKLLLHLPGLRTADHISGGSIESHLHSCPSGSTLCTSQRSGFTDALWLHPQVGS